MYLRSSSTLKSLIIQGIATGLLLFTFFACGTDPDESSASKSNELLQPVTPSERLFTHEDVDVTGFKTAKEYDVEGLPERLMFYSASGVRTAQRQRSTRFVFTLPMMLPSSQGRLSPTKLPVMTLFWTRTKRPGRKVSRTAGIFLPVQLEPMVVAGLKPSTVVMLFTGT